MDDGSYHRIEVSKKSTFWIKKKYNNLKQIGTGSYGIVCSADDSEKGIKVAIKKVKNVFEDLVDAKRILREIELLCHLGEHENVTSLFEISFGPPGKTDFKDLYIITELFECDLDRIVTSTQKLSDAHHQYFLYQILRGLKWIHSADVVHRDMKPSNLLVKSNCDMAICDFGLARGVPKEGDAMTDYVQTRWYRAPELLCDNTAYDKKVDVWSAGLIFAELLRRAPVLQGKDYFDQLEKIITLIGKPSESEMKHLQYETARKAIRRMGGKTNQIARAFGRYTTNPLALDLLKNMLVFDPAKRFSVEQCLAHKYLAELHQDGDEPVCKKKFDYSFEDGYKEEMPKALLQRHMIECSKRVAATQKKKMKGPLTEEKKKRPVAPEPEPKSA